MRSIVVVAFVVVVVAGARPARAQPILFSKVTPARHQLAIRGPFASAAPPAVGTPTGGVVPPSSAQPPGDDAPSGSGGAAAPLGGVLGEIEGALDPVDGAGPQVTGVPAWVTTYDPSGSGLRAIDLSVAASSTHLVVSAYDRLTFWTKDGKLVGAIPTRDFFDAVNDDMVKTLPDPVTGKSPMSADMAEFYDTRTIYDAYRRRFWILSIARSCRSKDCPNGDKKLRVNASAIAVSLTENPLDGFHTYWWFGERDYQALGVSDDLVVVGYRPFEQRTDAVTALVAAPLAAGSSTPGSAEVIDGLTDALGRTVGPLVPAMQRGKTRKHLQYFVARTGTSAIDVWALDPKDFSMYRATIPVRPFGKATLVDQRPHADIAHPHQIEDTNASNQFMKVVVNQGRLSGVAFDARTWKGASAPVTALRLVRLDVSKAPAPILIGPGSGFLDRTFGKRHPAEPKATVAAYYWPTLEVTHDRTAVVAYSRAGTTVFPELRASLQYAKEKRVRPSVLLRSGDYPLGGEDPASATRPDADPVGRLDFVGSALDPSDQRTVWFVSAHATRDTVGTGRYALALVRITPPRP